MALGLPRRRSPRGRGDGSCCCPRLRRLLDNPEPSSVATRGRLALAVVVAGAVVALDVAGRASAAIGVVAAVVALVVVLLAVRPLLPPGTLGGARGLPAVVLLRGAIAATFFSTEIYLPYLLQEHYDVPPWLSGATLTVGALGWAGASQVQARLGARFDHHAALRIGAVLLLVGIAGELVSTALQLTPIVIGAAWVLAGAGMGLMFPRISARGPRRLERARPGPQQRRDVHLRRGRRCDGDLADRPGLHRRRPGVRVGAVRRGLALTTALALGALLVSRRTT